MAKKKNIDVDFKVAIVYRPDSDAALALAKKVTDWLGSKKFGAFTAPEQKSIPKTVLLKKRSDLCNMNLILVLGGDGTYLRAIRLLEGNPVPILGVNLGSLGFLTPFRADEVFAAVEKSIQNKLEHRPRTMIQLELVRKGKSRLMVNALNDVVIERGSFSQLINLSIHSEKHLVCEVKADGLIVASPTGSTAYNLSAGGPILHPEVHAFVVTPIAPHSLTSRPLIFPDDRPLRFQLLGKNPSLKPSAHLVIDGFKVEDLTIDDEIYLSRSSQEHLMVRDPNQNYFHLLRQKLKFGDR